MGYDKDYIWHIFYEWMGVLVRTREKIEIKFLSIYYISATLFHLLLLFFFWSNQLIAAWSFFLRTTHPGTSVMFISIVSFYTPFTRFMLELSLILGVIELLAIKFSMEWD